MIANLAPIAAAMVLSQVALGTSVISHGLAYAGHVGRGFVGTTGVICAAFAGLALLVFANLDVSGVAGLRAASASSVNHWLAILLGALLLDALFCAVGTDKARYVIDGLLLLVCAVAGTYLVGLFSGISGVGPALTAVLSGALLNGAIWAGMLLGHWYLVTPSMSFKPLRQSVWLIFAAVVAEAIVIVVALTSTTARVSSQITGGDQAFLFWALVVGSGVVFTAGVNAFTYYFARIRANQPATAMLYVLIISALMGVVPAQLIYLQTGAGI